MSPSSNKNVQTRASTTEVKQTCTACWARQEIKIGQPQLKALAEKFAKEHAKCGGANANTNQRRKRT